MESSDHVDATQPQILSDQAEASLHDGLRIKKGEVVLHLTNLEALELLEYLYQKKLAILQAAHGTRSEPPSA